MSDNQWEPLPTAEAVVEAIKAGRWVEYIAPIPARGGWYKYNGGNEAAVKYLISEGAEFRAMISPILIKPAQPAADAVPAIPAGYKPWGGGECPEDALGVKTTVICQDGSISTNDDGELFMWEHSRNPHPKGWRIIAYRVDEPAAVDPADAEPARAVQAPEDSTQSQDWAGMDGAVAWHLIDRHADNWNEAGKMMDAWLAANAARAVAPKADAPAEPAEDAPCPILAWCMDRELFDAANASHDAPYCPEDIVAALTEYEAALVAAAEIAHREGVRLYSAAEIKAEVQRERALAYEEGRKAAEARLARKAAEPAEVEALAAKVGVYYADGVVRYGAPLYAFTPAELREFARRLRPVVVDDAMKRRAAIAISEVRQGNGKAFRQFMPEAEAALTAAIHPEGRSDG